MTTKIDEDLRRIVNSYSLDVFWDEDSQEYIGLVEEFPSLSFCASSPPEAMRGIYEILIDVVRDMLEADETLPPPNPEP